MDSHGRVRSTAATHRDLYLRSRADTDTSLRVSFRARSSRAEWREYCIESSGMPINACSYFQSEEFPAFMGFFYFAQYFIQVVHLIFRIYVVSRTCKDLIGCLKRTRKYDGGLRALLTPWGVEKSPEATQMTAYRFGIALPYIWCFAGMSFCVAVTSAFAPGFGLVNSLGTGKLYFGSKWNEFPLPE